MIIAPIQHYISGDQNAVTAGRAGREQLQTRELTRRVLSQSYNPVLVYGQPFYGRLYFATSTLTHNQLRPPKSVHDLFSKLETPTFNPPLQTEPVQTFIRIIISLPHGRQKVQHNAAIKRKEKQFMIQRMSLSKRVRSARTHQKSESTPNPKRRHLPRNKINPKTPNTVSFRHARHPTSSSFPSQASPPHSLAYYLQQRELSVHNLMRSHRPQASTQHTHTHPQCRPDTPNTPP
jgi:hypothetical protein